MTRNTERRVEIACPVLDPWARRRLMGIISHLLADTQKARVLRPDGSYVPRTGNGPRHNCQEYFQTESVPVPVPAQPQRRHAFLPQRLRRLLFKP